jgi:hypothetical protein
MITTDSLRTIENKLTSISPEWERLYNDRRICGIVCRTDSLIMICLEKSEASALVSELLDHRARVTYAVPDPNDNRCSCGGKVNEIRPGKWQCENCE